MREFASAHRAQALGSQRDGGAAARWRVFYACFTRAQVLPRRKGDLWIHVSSVFFKTWERRHAVIDGTSVLAAV